MGAVPKNMGAVPKYRGCPYFINRFLPDYIYFLSLKEKNMGAVPLLWALSLFYF